MKEPMPQMNKSPEIESKQGGEERELSYEAAKRKINVLFDSYETGQERIDDLIEQIGNFDFLDNRNQLKTELERCADIKWKKEFIERVFAIIKPIIDLSLDRPELFPEGGSSKEFVRINELISYERKGNICYIHIIPEGKVEQGLSEFMSGMKNLAKVVDGDRNIETIEATSWIVAKHPRLLEKFGFTVDGEISKEVRAVHFPGDKSMISKAHISRNDFLKKYLA